MPRFAGLLALALVLAPAAAAQGYEPPRNAMGQPDLSGLWTNATRTALERDPRHGDSLVLPAEEAARAPAGDGGVMSVAGQPRTSFLVAPANGRLPPFAPDAIAARAHRLATNPHGSRGDNPESMTLAERCLRDFGSSSGPPMMPVGYNNTYQIVQTPDHVMILVEMIHDARIIPLTDKHQPSAIKQWMGDAVGRYEGDTLIVETTNFRPNQTFAGGPQDLKVIEKFRRVGDTQILYSFEIDDRRLFTAPIRAEIAMNATKGPLFEYACHEGNSYSFAGMLQGQRLADEENAKLIAEARKKKR